MTDEKDDPNNVVDLSARRAVRQMIETVSKPLDPPTGCDTFGAPGVAIADEVDRMVDRLKRSLSQDDLENLWVILNDEDDLGMLCDLLADVIAGRNPNFFRATIRTIPTDDAGRSLIISDRSSTMTESEKPSEIVGILVDDPEAPTADVPIRLDWPIDFVMCRFCGTRIGMGALNDAEDGYLAALGRFTDAHKECKR